MLEQLEDRTVPSGGPVSLWLADGNANDAIDGNNGTLQGGVSYGPGISGQAFSFDGTIGSVVVPDASNLDFTQTFTLSAWVNPSTIQQDPLQGGIVSKVGNNTGLMGYQLGITTGNTQVFFQFNSPGQPWPGHQLIANSTIPLNQWTFIVASYDQSDMNIYVNGTLAASRFIGPTTVATSGANYRISGDDNSNVHFAGLMTWASMTAPCQPVKFRIFSTESPYPRPLLRAPPQGPQTRSAWGRSLMRSPVHGQ
jgi:hypothetical protein